MMSTSGDLEGGGSGTFTLSTRGTVQLAFSGSPAQPHRINKTQGPNAILFFLMDQVDEKGLDRGSVSADTIEGLDSEPCIRAVMMMDGCNPRGAGGENNML